MASMPEAFPLFIALMAFLTSASVGGLVSMLRSSDVGGGRRVLLAGGGSQKYSSHLSASSRSAHVIVLPFLHFTGQSDLYDYHRDVW